MNDAVASPRARSFKRQRSIYQVHYALEPAHHETTVPLPHLGLQVYGQQVAGHGDKTHGKYLGLLQCNNGTILKPIIKEAQKREIDFYERVNSSNEPDLVELKRYIPKYHGCKKVTYNGYENEYIILEDLAQRMLEPCIMDIKIGKRTWDPLATEDKIENEKKKYGQCKQEYGFCIPGYQVYSITTGKLVKHGKDYGKKIHGKMVKDVLKSYLNASSGSACRALLLQLLAELWKLQKWAARQTTLRIYSSSLLLVYDAAPLRRCCGEADRLLGVPPCVPAANARRRRSVPALNTIDSSFSGQLTSKGPVYKKVNCVPITAITLAQNSFTPPSPTTNSPWSEALQRMNSIHSFEHNYEDKLSKIKMNYRALLDQLSSDDPKTSGWGTVKLIDFAHAFFNETDDEMGVDDNFKFGIDSLVELFEGFLKETDDQVF